jgi:multidrug resistance efflux pump
VVNTQLVHAGDVLVVLDETDARIAVSQAEAELGSARRKVMQIMANDTALSGQLDSREAGIQSAEHDVARARARFDKATLDERRRRNLVKAGAVSEQDLRMRRQNYGRQRPRWEKRKPVRKLLALAVSKQKDPGRRTRPCF